MSEKTKTPIEILTDALAEMTARAVEAERQRDHAIEEADSWYKAYLSSNKKCVETEAALATQREDNEVLRYRISELVERIENGGTENV